MSSETAISSRKEKKAQRDADRRKGGKKRKHAEVEDAALLEEVVEPQIDFPAAEAEQSRPQKLEPDAVRWQKASKRPRKDAPTNVEATASATPRSNNQKRKKTASTTDAVTADDETNPDKQTKSRFIVFLGNLPYNTTDTALQAHFKALQPFTLRHRTDKATKKSKGFAFLEFENYDRMKTCLKLYHHTMFDPDAKENGGTGKGNGKGGRKINVELTSGGGGNTAERKGKIKERNARLEEQRKRRALAEKKEKEKEKGKEKAVKGKSEGQSAEKQDPSDQAEDSSLGMHPSRLARLSRA